MNKLMVVLLALALVAPASAWTILGDNILGNNFDYVTLRNPSNGDSIVFNATTRKWEAGSGASGSLSIQTGGVAQGSATTLDFTNGIRASSTAVAGTFNVSPTFGTSANTITQGNDARHNVTPAAGVRGNIPVVDAAGTAYTSIDEGTATDQALMSLGANTPGAFRALIAADIDELLTVEQLVDVDITSLAAHHMLVRNGSSKWVNAVWAGDVTGTVAANTFATLIANDAVTDAKLRNASALSFIGRSTSTVGDPGDIDGTANQIPIVDSAGNTLDFRTISGDLTNATGVFTIANSAVTPAKMADLAGLSLLGRSASTSGVMAAITGTANQIPIVNSGGTAMAFTTLSGDVTNASGVMTIANNAVSNAKFRQGVARSLVGVAGNATANVADIQGTANQIPIVNSAGNALAFTTLSGDVTNSGGAMTIAAQAVGVSKMTATATKRMFGRHSAAAGAGEEVTAAQFLGWHGGPITTVSGGYVTRSGTNLLYAPDVSNVVWCFESSVWVPKIIPDSGITVACTGLAANTDFLLYVRDNAGTLTLSLESGTTLTTQNGIQVKSGATDRLFIARCRSNSSGAITTFADDASTQLVNNAYNKRRVSLFKGDTTDTWTYTTNTYRQANGSTANQVSVVTDGVQSVTSNVFHHGSNTNVVFFIAGIGIDSSTVNSATVLVPGVGGTGTGGESNTSALYEGVPSAGFHEFRWLEKSTATGTTTWYGDNGAGGVTWQDGITLTGQF